MKKILRLLLTIVLLGASVAIADAQQVIFLVRHTEQAVGIDPPLTEAGKHRAKRLAGVLKDAGIDVIYTTEFKRTGQTSEIVGRTLNIDVKIHPRRDVDGLIRRLQTQHVHDRVLIVDHSRLSVLLWDLGHREEVRIGQLDYDNLFVIIPKSDGDPLVLLLRY